MEVESKDLLNPLLFEGGVQAGFPSPTDEEVGNHLNLLQMLVPHPVATFYVRVKGDSMQGAGIFCGDILIVDRSLTPKDKDVVVAVVNKEFTVKRLSYQKGRPILLAENPAYSPIYCKAEDELEIWGVVTFVLHKP